MEVPVVQALITAGGSIVVAIITVVVKSWLDARAAKAAKEKEEVLNESDLEQMVVVQEWLEELRGRYQFDRAAIFQFHNGGKFFQGKSMKKFSMTYEAVAPGYEKIKRSMQNILTSEYPKWISRMFEKKCFVILTEEMEFKDRHELEQLGIQQFVTVPVNCLKGALIGFIVGYNISEVDENIKSSFVALVEDSKFISGYLA